MKENKKGYNRESLKYQVTYNIQVKMHEISIEDLEAWVLYSLNTGR